MIFTDYAMRLNSKLPKDTRKALDEHHINAVKLMKDMQSIWYVRGSSSIHELAIKYKINDSVLYKVISIWDIYLLTRFQKQQKIKYSHNELFRRRFAECCFSTKAFLRLRKTTILSDKRITPLFHIPTRQTAFIRDSYHIPLVSKKEQYKRKVITQNINNQKKYGPGIVNTFQLPSVKAKIKATNLKKCGDICARNNPKVRQKQIATLHKKYGSNINNPFQIPQVISTIQKKVNNISDGKIKVQQWSYKLLHNVDYINKLLKFLYWKNNNQRIPLIALNHHNPILNPANINKLFRENKYNKQSSYLFNKYILTGSTSNLEYGLKKELDKANITNEMHVHLLPKPFRRRHFDFYLPKYNILIELNPAFTHKNKDSYFNRFNVGGRNWKFHMAQKNGYTLINLYAKDFQNNYRLGMKKIQFAIIMLQQHKQLYCDDVPYMAQQNKTEKRLHQVCYTEGHTWWQ